MRIFVDMDGVLADFDRQFINYLREADVLKESYAPSWKLTDRISDSIAHKHSFVNRILSTPGFWSGIEEISDGCETIEMLRELEGVEIYIATSPWLSSPTCMNEKMRWIKQHIPGMELSKVIMIADKSLLSGDMLIDDKPSHISEWNGSHAIIYDQPWNQGITKLGVTEGGKHIWRAFNWINVFSIVQYLI